LLGKEDILTITLISRKTLASSYKGPNSGEFARVG